MLHYNLPVLHELLTNIGTLVNANISLYDENFNPTKAFTSNFPNPFCYALKDHVYHKCQLSDLNALKYLLEAEDSSYYYTCHMGLAEIAFRLSWEDKVYAYILVGPFRSPDKDADVLQMLHSYCEKYNYNYENLSKEYFSLSEFSLKKFEALKSLIYPIFEYTITKNIITPKSGMFVSIFEPYILQNLDQDLSVGTLCKIFYMSQKNLYNFFMENTGKSPKQYITEQRILKAKQLIYSTDLPLARIAESVGFNDYNYFIKVFKQQEHRTPMYFKKNKKS